MFRSVKSLTANSGNRVRRKRRLAWALLTVLTLATLYATTLFFPDLFFRHTRMGEFVEVNADNPLPPSAATVIQQAEQLLRESPLVHDSGSYSIYVCQSAWRWNYFSGFKRQGRAFATPVGRAIYTREARWNQNELLNSRGVPGPRTLHRYLAHEVVHIATLDYLGPGKEVRLPVWLREGYADYIARRDAFDYRATRQRLLDGDSTLVHRKGDPYLKYMLLVSYLLDREHRDIKELLDNPPDAKEVERRVRAEAPPSPLK